SNWYRRKYSSWSNARCGGSLAPISGEASPDIGANDPPHRALLQLEYFRRYQLDVQSHFYDVRQRQHQSSADRTVTYAAAAGFVAAFSTGLAGLLGAGEGTDWAGLAALGIVGTSIATFAGVRESIT